MATTTLTAYTCWQIAEAAISTRPRVLLYGQPGTGKTYAATTYGVKPDTPIYSITVTPETPAAEMRGMYIPHGDKFEWTDGPAVRAWREGGRLVLNEIDRASGDLMSLLLAVCDDPGFARLTLPTGETVRPAPGFTVVATTNAVPDDLDFALRDRFTVCVHIDKVAPGAIASLPPDLRGVAAATGTHQDSARRIGFRAWHEYAVLRAQVGRDMALVAVFGNRARDVLNAMLVGGVA